MNDIRYDILIIGCGPAGISAATILNKKKKKIRIALIDVGDHYKNRYCFVDHGKKCANCQPCCKVVSGYGGSVHYGDSIKLSKFPAGKHLISLLGKDRANKYMNIVLNSFWDGGKCKNFILPKTECLPFKNVKCYPIATLNTQEVKTFLRTTYKNLEKAKNVDLFLNTEVISIQHMKRNNNFEILCIVNNKNQIQLSANKIIFAGGRHGLNWWKKTINSLGIKHEPGIPSFGLRFEGPKELFRKAGEIHPDLKLSFYKKQYKIKTFCFCGGTGGGRIKTINYGPFNLLDGHIVTGRNYKGHPGNFALMIKNELPKKKYDMKKRTDEIISKYKTLNPLNAGKPVFQLYKDFRRNTATPFSIDRLESQLEFIPSIRDIEPSNLASLFRKKEHSYFCEIFENIFQGLYFLSSLPKNLQYQNKILDYMLVIGIEMEDCWDRIILTPKMETSVKNIYVAGDATGVAQGILQAMISGVAVAEGCLR